jgi:hypothetical protein
MTEVTIMLGESKDESPVPDVLLADGGLWSQTRKPTCTSLTDSRERFMREVRNAVVRKDDADAVKHLAAIAQSLFLDVVGSDLEDALRAARETAGDDPPLLTIHLYPRDEWIPWELLNDGEDFLGVRFRIARMPILATPSHRPSESKHRLDIVRSVLGNGVAGRDTDEYAAWQTTFEQIVPNGAHTTRIPPPDNAAAPCPTVDDLLEEADILHITCHGKAAENNKPPAWTLDPQAELPDRYDFDRALTNSLRRPFARRSPLVFANACSQEASGLPPVQPLLASEMVAAGAANFIGTLAPIRPKVAMRVARHFFEALLRDGQDVSTALLSAKQRCGTDPEIATDPTYLLYCLYGPPSTRFVVSHGCG